MKPRARWCERSPGAAAARSAAELRPPPLRGWRWWGKQPAWGWDGMDWTAALCVPVCLCVCVCVSACVWCTGCVCLYLRDPGKPLLRAALEQPPEPGREKSWRQTQRGRATHAHTHPHTLTHTHTHRETCYTLHRRNTGAESKSWRGSLFAGRRKEKHPQTQKLPPLRESSRSEPQNYRLPASEESKKRLFGGVDLCKCPVWSEPRKYFLFFH